MAEINGYEQVTLKLTGVTPLIVHSGQLADPLNKFSKAIKQVSSKRKKVDADYEEMARLEFLGGLYLRDSRPCMPGVALEAMMISAAKKVKRGMDFKSGLMIDDSPFIEYDGPTDPNGLWEDERFRIVAGVKVGQARVMRTRPQFPDWSLEFTASYIDQLLDRRTVEEVAIIAGWQIGLCEWRPKFGRFKVDVVK